MVLLLISIRLLGWVFAFHVLTIALGLSQVSSTSGNREVGWRWIGGCLTRSVHLVVIRIRWSLYPFNCIAIFHWRTSSLVPAGGGGGSTGGAGGGGSPPNLSIGGASPPPPPPTLGYNTKRCLRVHYCLYSVIVYTG